MAAVKACHWATATATVGFRDTAMTSNRCPAPPLTGVRRRDGRREEAPGSAASRWLAGLAVRSKSSNGTSMRPGQRGGGAASFRLAEISSSASFMSFIPFMVFLSMSSVEPRVFS